MSVEVQTELRLEFYTVDGQDVYLGAFLGQSGSDRQLLATAGDHVDGQPSLFRDVPFTEVEEFLNRCRLQAMAVDAKLVVDPEVYEREDPS